MFAQACGIAACSLQRFMRSASKPSSKQLVILKLEFNLPTRSRVYKIIAVSMDHRSRADIWGWLAKTSLPTMCNHLNMPLSPQGNTNPSASSEPALTTITPGKGRELRCLVDIGLPITHCNDAVRKNSISSKYWFFNCQSTIQLQCDRVSIVASYTTMKRQT